MPAIRPQHHEQHRDLRSFPGGDVACPCLPLSEIPVAPSSIRINDDRDITGVNTTEYGVGCGSHDVEIAECRQPGAPTWCRRAWCWVDPTTCHLLHRRSPSFPTRYNSYAACRNIDFHAAEERIHSLSGRTIRIALNHDRGGWKGAYSEFGIDFTGGLNQWSGPTVEFVKTAAERANMKLQITKIPRELYQKAASFFGESLNEDVCIYAAALGFVDLCVGDYSISKNEQPLVTI